MNASTEEYKDLLEVLADVKRRNPDSRCIWCAAADGFETTVAHRRGLVLGGAWSPHFLRDTGSSTWAHVPLTMHLWNPHVVVIEKATEPLAAWLPLMEAVAQSGTSLLVVTKEISSELLRTFIVNSAKATLACCAVQWAETRPGLALPGTGSTGKSLEVVPKKTDGLMQASEAWIRRTATVLFPASDDAWRLSLSDVSVIMAGGEDHDDQQDRLRFLVRAIQSPATKLA